MAAWVVPVISAVASAASVIFAPKSKTSSPVADPVAGMSDAQKQAYYAAMAAGSGGVSLAGTSGAVPTSPNAAVDTSFIGTAKRWLLSPIVLIVAAIMLLWFFVLPLFRKRRRPTRRRRTSYVAPRSRRRVTRRVGGVSKSEFVRRMQAGKRRAARKRKK